MRQLVTLANLTERPVKALLIILMALLVLTVCWQVITRFILPQPSSFTEELSRFTLIWIGLLGSALTYKTRMHLGIDVFTNKLQGMKKLYAAVCVHIVAGLFAVMVMIYGGNNLVQLTFELNQVSPSLGIPMGYVYTALPIAGALILLYSLSFIAQEISSIGGEKQ